MTIEDVLGGVPVRNELGLVEQATVVDAAALARASRRISEAGTTGLAVEQIVLFATRTFDTPFVGVTMLQSRDRFETLGAASDLVAQTDELQYSAREGPCVDATTESSTVTSENLAADTRWPRWGPQAAGLGFLSVLSAELSAGGVRMGFLNIYGAKTRQFTLAQVQTARIFASHASVALAAIRTAEDLEQALESRTVIGQAQGILMERFTVDADRAFAILRRYSQDTNVKLADVAGRLVQTSVLLETAAQANSGPFRVV